MVSLRFGSTRMVLLTGLAEWDLVSAIRPATEWEATKLFIHGC